MIISYIAVHWVEWMFSISTAVLGFLYCQTARRLKKEEQTKNKAATMLRRNCIIHF